MQLGKISILDFCFMFVVLFHGCNGNWSHVFIAVVSYVVLTLVSLAL